MKNNIAKSINQIRDMEELTQQEFADKLNVSKPAVCQWETSGNVSIENLYKISKLFGISIDDIIQNNIIDYSRPRFEKKYSFSNEIIKNIDKSSKKDVLINCSKLIDGFERFSELRKQKMAGQFDDINDSEYEFLLFHLFNVLKEQPFERNKHYYEDHYWHICARFTGLDVFGLFVDDYIDLSKRIIQYLSQDEKNEILGNLVNDANYYFGENIKTVKLLLDNGAVMLYKPFQDSDEFGNGGYFQYGLECKPLMNLSEVNNWYNTDKSEREDMSQDFFIDYESTERLKTIVNLKSKDPVAYAKFLLNKEILL